MSPMRMYHIRFVLACGVLSLVDVVADMPPLSFLQAKNNNNGRAGAQPKVLHQARVVFIPNPAPKSSEEMQKVVTTDMLKKTSAGLTFFAYPSNQDIYVSASITDQSYWEKSESDSVCAKFEPLKGKADFLDVGANIGTWSIPMARCLKELKHGGSVIAVEAMPAFADHLAASINANSFDNVNLYNYAVGEGNSINVLSEKLDANNKGGSYIDPSSGRPANPSAVPSGTIPVYMTTLDSILADTKPKIFAMKMDIENFEFYALRGAPEMLSKDNAPCLIRIELRVGVNDPSTKAMQLLKDKGYEEAEYFGDYNYMMRRSDFAACLERFAS